MKKIKILFSSAILLGFVGAIVLSFQNFENLPSGGPPAKTTNFKIPIYGVSYSIPVTTPLPWGPVGNWNLVFHDEFDENVLDRSKWITSLPWSNGYATWVSPNEISINNSLANLFITNTPSGSCPHVPGGVCPYTGSILSSHQRFSFTYGVVEIRFQVPQGPGFDSGAALYAESEDWPPEIDITENTTIGPGPIPTPPATPPPTLMPGTVEALMSVHWGTNQSPQVDAEPYLGTTGQYMDVSSQFHTYTVNWQPNSITWYIDGVQGRSPFTQINGIPSVPMYVAINPIACWPSSVGIGGNPPWCMLADGTTPFPADMQIKYVRVWQ